MHPNFDLTTYNTLKVPAKAANFIEITDFNKLPQTSDPYLILGDGANILFTKDFPGLVLKISVPGWTVISESDTEVIIAASAGQNWHELVMATVKNNWSGMENMAFIPGTVGAAAAGNIAAYGQNQQNILDHLVATDLTTGKSEKFTNTDCKFAYRESIFKQPNYHKFLITSVQYKLSKVPHLNTSYTATRHASLLPELEKIYRQRTGGAMQKNRAQPDAGNDQAVEHVFSNGEPANYSVADVAQAVINLRTAKLPDWKSLGTAGSFFKNPVVPLSQVSHLKSLVPDLQIYPAEKLTYQKPDDQSEYVKIPAGQLFDELGWRGKREGPVGTYPTHALIVCNFGGATGKQVYDFSENMRADFKSHYDIDLDYEVVII